MIQLIWKELKDLSVFHKVLKPDTDNELDSF